MEIRLLSGKEVLDAAILIKEVLTSSKKPVYSETAAQSVMDFFLEHSSSMVCLGAFRDQLIGLLAFNEETFHINMFAVDPASQMQGVGRLLMENFIGTARAAGIARVTVSSVVETVPVYEALGFQKNGEVSKEGGLTLQPMEYLLGSEFLGKTVTVTVDQPYGSMHTHYADLEMPCNYGYVEDLLLAQGIFQNAYVYGVEEPVESFKGIVIGIVYHSVSSESRWIVGPSAVFDRSEVINVIGSMEESFESQILWLNTIA